MPLGNWNVEWANLNSQRRYPLAIDADGVDLTGTFIIPNSFLVALDLPIPAAVDMDPAGFFIQTIAVYSSGFSITVAYQPAGGDDEPVPAAIAMFARAEHVTNKMYSLVGLDTFAGGVGKITVGNLTDIDEQPSGVFTFDLDHARIDPDCIRPQLRGLGAIYVVDAAGNRSDPIYGDIELVAQQNIQLDADTDGSLQYIRISAISDENLTMVCSCPATGTPITTINGVGPDAAGNITLLGDDCLQVSTLSTGLQIVDVCSKPCCGCAELEVITRDLQAFGAKATTLENFINRLEAQITTMNQVVLGSRLGDQGCGS